MSSFLRATPLWSGCSTLRECEYSMKTREFQKSMRPQSQTQQKSTAAHASAMPHVVSHGLGTSQLEQQVPFGTMMTPTHPHHSDSVTRHGRCARWMQGHSFLSVQKGLWGWHHWHMAHGIQEPASELRRLLLAIRCFRRNYGSLSIRYSCRGFCGVVCCDERADGDTALQPLTTTGMEHSPAVRAS